MGWMKQLSDTYDAYAHLAGKEDEKAVLLPISHSTVNAQLEITIDYEGNIQLYECNAVPKDGKEEVTIIPVTEDSASRSSGVTPHPLCDKLCYVAGDYSKYTREDKEKYYEAYINGLREWAESEYTHPMVQAIYLYLKKGCLIQDLLERELLKLDEKGRLSDEVYKLQNFGQTGAVVRFKVSHPNVYGEVTEVWKNPEVYQRYIEYYASKQKKTDLCYVTGEMTVCTDKHMAKIRNSGDKAKLISANDETNFTYLGRFTNKGEALSIGYETSQKAHLALRWLMEKQGYTRDGAAMVAWCINKKIPNVFAESVKAYDGILEESIFYADEEALEEDDPGEDYADKFKKAVQGYAKEFEANHQVILIALDAATAGRMSISYYHEFGANEYLQRVSGWHQKCSYMRFITDKEGNSRKVKCAPAPREIALAAFGVQRDKGRLEGDSKLLRSTVLRLLPCILNGRKSTAHVIPADIMKAIISNVSRPEAYSNMTWDYIRRIACALLKYDKFGGEDKEMDLTIERNLEDRDFLFGRLFAILEHIEQRGYYKQHGKKEERLSVMKRYWSAGVKRPAKTYTAVYENILHYEKNLSPESRAYLEKLCSGIVVQLKEIGGFHNSPLKETYIVGYSQQKEELLKKETGNKGGNEDGEIDE